jgi:hypothetical protein
MSTDPGLEPPGTVEDVLARKSLGDAHARAALLLAVREHGRDDQAFTAQRLEALMRVEEHFQSLLLFDQIGFLRAAGKPAPAEREFGLDVQRILLEAANGLQRFLRRRSEWSAGTTPETTYRAVGLTINAIHGFLKWGNFLEEPGRVAPWRQLHALYALAENEGFSQVPFVLHPSQPSFKPSVQSLYLRTLILDLLDIGHLSKVQVEIADGWFSSWCNDYSLDVEYSSRQHLFVVDLQADAGMRLVRRDTHGDAMRYLRTEGLKAQVEEVQAGLRHGRLYAGYGAGALFPVEEHVAVLAIIERLYQSILAGSENRIEERENLEDREVDVAVGIERVMRKVREKSALRAAAAPEAASETIEITPAGLARVETIASDEALPFDALQADPDVERWRVGDVSSRGFGLLVDRVAADLVMLNGLIALRNHDSGGWILGTVVRKQARAGGGEMLLGVEVLSYRPIAVELVPSQGKPAPALFLAGLDTNGKLDGLLVRPGDFRSDAPYALRTGGALYRVRLNRIIRKGPDWINARFELVSKA